MWTTTGQNPWFHGKHHSSYASSLSWIRMCMGVGNDGFTALLSSLQVVRVDFTQRDQNPCHTKVLLFQANVRRTSLTADYWLTMLDVLISTTDLISSYMLHMSLTPQVSQLHLASFCYPLGKNQINLSSHWWKKSQLSCQSHKGNCIMHRQSSCNWAIYQ